MARQRIILALASQELVIDKLPDGRADSHPTITIYDPANSVGTVVNTGTTTQDSVSTTLNGAAGPAQSDPTLCTLTSGTGVVVGRPYLFTGTLGQSEWVVFERGSTTTWYATRALAFDYATASTVKSARVTYSLPSSLTSTGGHFATEYNLRDGYLARLRYDVSSKPKSYDHYFDLVRAPFDQWATIEDLLAECPNLRKQEPSEQKGKDYEPQRQAAIRYVEADLKSAGVRVDLLKGGDWFKPLHITKWKYLIADGCGVAPYARDPQEWRDHLDASYKDLLSRVVGVLRENYDANDDGAISDDEAVTPRSDLGFTL